MVPTLHEGEPFVAARAGAGILEIGDQLPAVAEAGERVGVRCGVQYVA